MRWGAARPRGVPGVGCPVEVQQGVGCSVGAGPGQGLFWRLPWDWRTGESVWSRGEVGPDRSPGVRSQQLLPPEEVGYGV